MGRCFDFPAVSLHLIDKSEKNAYNIIAGKIALYTRVTELTFKCHVLAPATGKPPKGGFFLRRSKWIYNDIFVYGGLILFDGCQVEEYTRRYLAAERAIRQSIDTSTGDCKYSNDEELKACTITNIEKGKLFRSLNNAFSFGIIINQKRILDQIFRDKKSKQRYLDYAYKIVQIDNVKNIHIFCDEHTTATNGRYELREALEQEFKSGTYNYNYAQFFPPIFPEMGKLSLHFCNSSIVPLIRAADIVANRIYFHGLNSDGGKLSKISLTLLP